MEEGVEREVGIVISVLGGGEGMAALNCANRIPAWLNENVDCEIWVGGRIVWPGESEVSEGGETKQKDAPVA